MAVAMKGCTNENCVARKRKIVFRDTDRFCTRCGKPLSYVCRNCWKELPDDTQLYCSECTEKKQNSRNWLDAIAENSKHVGESLTETGKRVGENLTEAGKRVGGNLTEAGKRVGENLTSTGKWVGENLTETGKHMGENISETRRRTMDELNNIRNKRAEEKAHPVAEIRINGAGTLKIPEDYSRLRKSRPANIDFSSQTTGFTTGNAKFRGYFLVYKIEEDSALAFDNVQTIIDGLHEKMAEDTGLIEAAAGNTVGGKPYAYHITKHALKGMGGISLGTEYLICMNFRLEDGIACLEGSFTESTINGNRNSDIFGKMSMDGSMDFDLGSWEGDPYDPQYLRGFLMNRSERAEFDEQYPDHPLSRIRKLAAFMVENN